MFCTEEGKRMHWIKEGLRLLKKYVPLSSVSIAAIEEAVDGKGTLLFLPDSVYDEDLLDWFDGQLGKLPRRGTDET